MPDDPLDVVWRYCATVIPDLRKRRTSEKPLREWFEMDHNSNVEIERRDDGVKSTVAIEFQKIHGVSDRRGTRDDEIDRRGDSRDRQRERPYERERGGYEPPRVVVVARPHGVPASYGNASNPPPPMQAPPPDPPPPPPAQPAPPHRHEGFANPPPPPASRSAWDRGRAPTLSSAAAPFYPGAGPRPSAAPMGSLPYGGGVQASMASMAPMASMASMAPMASAAHGAAPSAPSTAPQKYVRPSRYDAYDTDRDDDSDTDPEEARRRRESLARDPSRRPRDAPGELPSEDARRRRSGSESLSRRDSLGASRALPIPKALPGAGTHAASRVSGILNAIPGPGRLSAPKLMMPVGAAAAPRVKDTGFEERARALADEKKRKAAEAAAAEAAEAEAERAAAKRAKLAKEAKEAKEAARAVPKPEPKTIEVSDDDGADDELRVIHDDNDRRVVNVEHDDDSGSDVVLDDDEDDEARRERRRAAKKLKKEKKLKKKMSDASEKAEKSKAEKSIEERQAEPIAPLGGKFPDDAVWIIHNDKYPAYYLFARDVYVQRLYRNAGSAKAKETPDLCIRRFRVKVSDAEDPEYTEVDFENTDPTGKVASGKSTRILRSMLALFRWAAREWGRDSDDLKQFFKEYGEGKGNNKSFKDTMDGKD